MAQVIPSTASDQRIAVQRYLSSNGVLRNLNIRTKRPIVPTNCPTLDWATGIGGWARGRIIEMYGKESTGKCSLADTLVPVPGQGILTLEEMAQKAAWTDGSTKTENRTPDSHASLSMEVVNAHGTTQTTHSYFPGMIDTTILFTQHGHTIQGSPTHRVLTLTKYGLLSWTTLANARPEDVVFTMMNTKVTNKGKTIDLPLGVEPGFTRTRVVDNKDYAALLGALTGCESRQGAFHLISACVSQRRYVKDWSRRLGVEDPFEANPKWTAFTGLVKLVPEVEALARLAVYPEALKAVRHASLTLQRAWAAGLSLSYGQWTHDHLEIEIKHEEVARIFQAICENVGVRWTRYFTLNTFGDSRWKLSLRSRSDQQRAEKVLWDGYQLPQTWKKFYSPEEDENPSTVKRTVEMAREVLEKAGKSVAEIDLEDTTKETCRDLVRQIAPLPNRSKTVVRLVETLAILGDERLTFDVVRGIQAAGPAYCYDLSVPIGQHYAANGLVSHNSTVALHTCKQELASRPDSFCLYMDFERAVPEEYVEAMGLMEYADRFFLVDPDSLEAGNKIVVDLYKEKLVPSIVVVDSVAAATPQDIFARDMEDNAPVALRARKWSEILETWSKYGGDYGTMFMLLNQTRTKIITDPRNKPRQIPGAIGAELEETPGGLAIKFYSSMRVRLEPQKVIVANVFNPMTGEEEQTPIANLVKAFFIKNKLAAPFRKAVFYIQFGKGIDVTRTMVELAILRNFVQQEGRGGYVLTLPDGRQLSGKGEEGLVEALKADANAQVQMAKLLQWDQADTLANQAKSFSTVIPGQGVVPAKDLDTGLAEFISVNNLTLSMLNREATLAGKGLVLGLVEKVGRVYSYKTTGGQEVRAATLQSMADKLKGHIRDDLQAKVDQAIVILTEMDGQNTPPPAADPVVEGNVGEVAPGPEEKVATTP